MTDRSARPRIAYLVLCLAAWLVLAALELNAQRGRGQGPAGPPAPPREQAPIDLTGYWVSLITEDWRYRMVTPPRGDVTSLPVTAEGRRAAMAYDPVKDEAAGEQCKAYGAPGVMRMPTRLHITWQDDNTLKIETDTGQQTRLLHFDTQRPATLDQSWQGYSVATWEFSTRVGRQGNAGRNTASGPGPGGNLKVVTTALRAGYLRTNGVPYSENAVLTEYFDRHTERGIDYITHARIVDDPRNLTEPHVVTSHFKRELDGSKWAPTPCVAGRPFK